MNWRVFIPASAAVLAFSLWAMLAPDNASSTMQGMVGWIAENLGWFYVLTVTLVIGFVLVMIIGLAFLVADRWRRGTVTIGSAMLFLGLLRWLVDGEILGVLSVRSRRFDSAFCVTVGSVMLAVAMSVDPLGS